MHHDHTYRSFSIAARFIASDAPPEADAQV
jgi:hypothetical protein